MIIEQTPNPYQVKALQLLSRPELQVLGLYGGKGSSKSFCSRLWIISRMLKYPNARGMILRRTFDDLKRTFQDKIELEYKGLYESYNNQTHTFNFANGSKIELAYLDGEKDTKRFFGLELDSVIIDECQQLPEHVFHMMRTTLRTINPNIVPKMIVTFNWGDVGHNYLKRIFHDRIFNANEVPERFGSLFGTIKDNPDLMKADPSYIKTLEELPETERRMYLDGDPSVAVGQFFKEFRPTLLIEPPFMILRASMKGRLFGSLDSGTSHSTSFGLWYIDEKLILHRLFTYCSNGMTIAEHAQEIFDMIDSFKYSSGYFPEKVFADPSMWTQVKLNQASIRSPIDEYIDLFKNRGKSTQFIKANNNRPNGCQIMRGMFAGVRIRYFDGYNTSFVNATISAIIDPNNIESYKKVSTDDDDVNDESRYGIVGCHSEIATITQRIKPVKPLSWEEMISKPTQKSLWAV